MLAYPQTNRYFARKEDGVRKNFMTVEEVRRLGCEVGKLALKRARRQHPNDVDWEDMDQFISGEFNKRGIWYAENRRSSVRFYAGKGGKVIRVALDVWESHRAPPIVMTSVGPRRKSEKLIDSSPSPQTKKEREVTSVEELVALTEEKLRPIWEATEESLKRILTPKTSRTETYEIMGIVLDHFILGEEKPRHPK